MVLRIVCFERVSLDLDTCFICIIIIYFGQLRIYKMMYHKITKERKEIKLVRYNLVEQLY